MMGIYRIRNVNDGYCYIGSAVNIDYRWQWHRGQLNKGKHPTRYLQQAWDKHGADAFVFEAIKEVDNKDSLLMHEAEAMSQHRFLYNQTIMDINRMRRRKAQERAAVDQSERRREFIRMLAQGIPDERVMVVSCLDCGELHHFTHSGWRTSIEAIDREAADELKADILDIEMYKQGIEPDEIALQAFSNVVRVIG